MKPTPHLLRSAALLFLPWLLSLTAHGQYQWTNFVGLPGGYGNVNGTGSAARFDAPSGVVVDSGGNIFVADYANNVIRKVTVAGVVTTFAGTTGVLGLVDGTGTSAQFYNPFGLAIDSSDNIYVADSQNNAIRKVTPAGVVTTLAGGSSGHADGTGAAASFQLPLGITLDGSGNLYVADTVNSTIRKITPAGVVTTLAGTAGATGSTNATGAAARFNLPAGIVFDASSGSLYVADSNNSSIRKVTLAGVVTTFAGTAGSASTLDGTGTAARFNVPYCISRDSSGNLYVGDEQDQVLRKITPAGVVSTLAGTAGTAGNVDATGTAATFDTPYGITSDGSGNLYVTCAGGGASTLRKVTSAGVVTTLAGAPAHPGSADGTGSAARFDYPMSGAVDSSGNLFVTDSNNHTIRKVTPAGVVTTFVGSAGQQGTTDGTGSAALYAYPACITIDSSGNLYTTDGNASVRKITPAGVVTTLAGGGTSQHLDGTGTAAQFDVPAGIAVDSSGNIFVAEESGNCIRKITTGNVVTTFVGSPEVQGSADGTGAAARFNTPQFMVIDASNNLYLADSNNCTIRKITPAGVVTTLAGSPGLYDTVDGTGSAARFYFPVGMAIDASGTLYVTELSGTIRKVTQAGVVTTIAGTPGANGSEDGIGAAAQFNMEVSGAGLAVTPDGSKLYVIDSANNRISKGAIPSASAPTVTTPTSASITGTGATLGGNVTSDGGATISELGVVFSVTSTNSSPHIGDTGVTKVSTTGNTGIFTLSSGTLSPGTAYSYAAYATNSAGTSYSSTGTFTTLSNNASLSALSLSAGTLSPSFSSGTTSYTSSVANAVTSTTLTAIKTDTTATMQIRINGGSYAALTSGVASGPLSLNIGANTINVLVTAQDGTTTSTYTTTVTRAASNNAGLASLVLSSGTLSPVFSTGITGYTVTVLRPTAAITVTPTTVDSNATLQIRLNGAAYTGITSGTASGSLALNLGANTIDVLVTAQDGTTTQTYTTTVTRWTYLQGWRSQYFSTINNSGSAADTTTPQNDGIANLMKFALGMNPTVNGVTPTSVGYNSGTTTLSFTYPRSVQAMAECTFIVEWSDTLLNGSWSTTGVTEQILSDNGTLQQISASIPAAGQTRRFARLRVTTP